MNSKFYNVIKPIIDYTLMAVCFIMIIITGIKEKSHPICVWPLINSLLIMILSMRAYRIAHLLGSINCLIYTVGFLIVGVYGSLISTLFVSFPVQLATFFMWGKRKYKKATMFRKLPIIWEIVLTVGIVGACVVGALVLGNVEGAKQSTLDSICMVLGIIIPFMSMFALVETIVFDIINTTVALVMWILIIVDDPMQAPYLVSAIFNLYCVCFRAIKWVQLYVTQQKEKNKAQLEKNETLEIA